MSYKPNADSLYKSMPISIMGYSDLNEIELRDGTIEYVERFDNQILVHKSMPNHWLVRMLSTEMTTRYVK